MDKKRYNNIDALRAFGCLAIIAFHIKVNGLFNMGGIIPDHIIPSFNWLVYLFMMISAFGMCNGYYEKFRNGGYDLNSFYAKRYKKNLPFFALLILANLLIEFSFDNLYEGLMEFTMLFGFLPNNSLEVIGVAWTLGTIFAFYVVFPYFVFLIYTTRRAWMALLASFCVTYMCETYFMTDKFVMDTFTNRHSFLFCLPFFITGGIIYLHRNAIGRFVDKNYWIMLSGCIALAILFQVIPDRVGKNDIIVIKALVLYSAWICLAIGKDVSFMANKITSFISSISMEMYLAHMFVFRMVEKANLTRLMGNNWKSYTATYSAVVLILIIGIKTYQKLWKRVVELIAARR